MCERGKYWKFGGKLLAAAVMLGWSLRIHGAPAVPDDLALVHADSSGRLAYARDAKGNVLPDFSFAGYMGGGVRIPDVAVKMTLEPQPGAGDDAARIQSAIDQIARLQPDRDGIRGTVLLKRGDYRVGREINVSTSGIVIRGEGDGTDGTILHATMKRPGSLIRVAGNGDRQEANEPRHEIISSIVPVGQLSMELASTDGLNVGDAIVIQRKTNEKWVKDNNMDDLGPREDGHRVVNWSPGLREQYNRTIVAIDKNRIAIDEPLTTAIESEYGGAIVFRRATDGQVQNCAIENLRAISEYTPGPGVAPQEGESYGVNFRDPANRGRIVGTDTFQHAATFITFDNCSDVWVSDFVCINFMYSGISVERNADRVTIQHGDYECPDPALGIYKVEPHDKAARYAYCVTGQHTLVQRCTTVHARHSFMTQSEVAGPTVFLDCDAKNQDSESQPHQRWSTGVLFDRVGRHVPTSIYLGNRKNMGSGHGWSGAYCMIWNSVGTFIVESPPTAPNWCVGSSGIRHAGPFEPFEPVNYQSWGTAVQPSSLYLAQLSDRLGAAAVENIEHHALASNVQPIYAADTPTTEPTTQPEVILTPPPPPTPRINGARVFGVRPGRPFLFTIPATGDDPITFSATGLPESLTLDRKTGQITGTAPTKEGDYNVTLTASNALAKDTKPLLIKVGDEICLTPPMGWNSWNCFAGAVDEEKVLDAAHAMFEKGLIKHGWTYINIDDTWQGDRGGDFNGLQGNHKFPDMKKMCDEIHGLGLKPGIYSTPWVTSYAQYAGGSAENPEGKWSKPTIPKKGNVNKKVLPWAVGKYSFATNDARQWAAWGFDYLKYDWNPIEVPQVQEMADALKASRRDFVLSLSNSAPFSGAADWARLSNAWRTASDIRDQWTTVVRNGFNTADKWNQFEGPGHYNDPDMLVVGMVGWGPKLHKTRLTPDEQYTHISLWCLLSAPMLIGCDMTKLDDFTLNLLTNDEVLAIDQDVLCKQAAPINADKTYQVWAKPLADGTWAVGLFNLGDETADVTVPFDALSLSGTQKVHDLWRQQDLPDATDKFTASVNSHGVVLLKIGTPKLDKAG
jgi:alpha-galactosidase